MDLAPRKNVPVESDRRQKDWCQKGRVMSSTQLMQKRRLGNFLFTLFERLLIRCDVKEGQVDP